MADRTSPYVRFVGVASRDPGWWHYNAGGERTHCGIKLPTAPEGLKHVEFSDQAKLAPTRAGQLDFCFRCHPVH